METTSKNAPLLDVRSLSVRFKTPGGVFEAVRNIDFSIGKEETLALVGESGSGKSVTALSVLRLLPYPLASHPEHSTVLFNGENLLGENENAIRRLRGKRIGMIFQEPLTALNPLHSIEKQIGEILRVHTDMTASQIQTRLLELLDLVGLPQLKTRLNACPHELSGGQRQRVMIAMALANEPDLLIADEPTTALDVTVQAQILELLQDLQKKMGMAILLITHDLSIVRKMADRVCVMRQGEIVEQADVRTLFDAPRHDYTKMLLAAQPKGHAVERNPDACSIVTCENLKVHFPVRKSFLGKTLESVKAVDDISLEIRAGQTVGVVGESGSGKTTLGLALLRLLASQGRVRFADLDISAFGRRDMRPLRARMQVVFQDPFGSLSPRMSVSQIVGEGLSVHKRALRPAEREERVIRALEQVEMDPDARHRYPHEFSGGQRQRVSIARAIVLEPEFLVLDEPTSALDVSVQAQIVDLLREIQKRTGMAYLFISHDLRVVRALSHDVLVMKDGRLVEAGPAERIFTAPEHPYTRALLDAALNIRTASGSAELLTS